MTSVPLRAPPRFYAPSVTAPTTNATTSVPHPTALRSPAPVFPPVVPVPLARPLVPVRVPVDPVVGDATREGMNVPLAGSWAMHESMAELTPAGLVGALVLTERFPAKLRTRRSVSRASTAGKKAKGRTSKPERSEPGFRSTPSQRRRASLERCTKRSRRRHPSCRCLRFRRRIHRSRRGASTRNRGGCRR